MVPATVDPLLVAEAFLLDLAADKELEWEQEDDRIPDDVDFELGVRERGHTNATHHEDKINLDVQPPPFRGGAHSVTPARRLLVKAVIDLGASIEYVMFLYVFTAFSVAFY